MTSTPMSDAELADALDGLCAYDEGCVDSGIHDEMLRARCRDQLKAMDEVKFGYLTGMDLFLARLIRDRMLSEDALSQGYGVADIRRFIEWLDHDMSITY